MQISRAFVGAIDQSLDSRLRRVIELLLSSAVPIDGTSHTENVSISDTRAESAVMESLGKNGERAISVMPDVLLRRHEIPESARPP